MDAGATDPFISTRVFCTKDVNILYSNCTLFNSYLMEDVISHSFIEVTIGNVLNIGIYQIRVHWTWIICPSFVSAWIPVHPS